MKCLIGLLMALMTPLEPIIADSENNFRYKDGSIDYPMNNRYENFVSRQNLTGFDKVSSLLTPYETRKLYYDFDEPCTDFFCKYESLRENVLYDSDNNRIIDIRNYAAQIISHIYSMKNTVIGLTVIEEDQFLVKTELILTDSMVIIGMEKEE